MENKELLPCPFCGGEAEVWITNDSAGVFVICESCFIRTPPNEFKEVVVKKWNTRTSTIKEFAEKIQRIDLRCYLEETMYGGQYMNNERFYDYIDNLVAEMEGADKEKFCRKFI